MQIDLLGERRDVPAADLSPETSPHTGHALQRRWLTFEVPFHEREKVADALQRARRGTHALSAADGSRWVVNRHSHRYVNNGPVSFDVELKESETVIAEQLDIAGVVLTPLYYSEEFNAGDALLIEVEVEPTGETAAALERLIDEPSHHRDHYLPVVRRGISDDVQSMRFGRCYWQQSVDHRRYLLNLVAETYDQSEGRGRGLMALTEPQMSNTSNLALRADTLAEALLAELIANGALTDSAAERVRTAAASAAERRWLELWQVGDLASFRSDDSN